MLAHANFRAALYSLTGAAILGFIDNFIASLSDEVSLWQFHLMRSVIAVPMIFAIGAVFGWGIAPKNLTRLTWRSVSVVAGLLIYFGALGIMSVAQAGAGLFTAPIWVLIFSGIFFAVRITLVHYAIILAGFAGVIMLLQPDLATITVLSIVPLFAGAFYGLGMLLTAKICQDESPLALTMGTILALGLVGAVLLVYFTVAPVDQPGFLTRGWVWPGSWFWGVTVLQAAGSIVAVTLIAKAYQIGTAHMVAVIDYSFLVFAILFAYLLWGTPTNWLAIGGIALIVLSGLAISAQTAREQ